MGSRLAVGHWILVPVTEVRSLSSQPIVFNVKSRDFMKNILQKQFKILLLMVGLFINFSTIQANSDDTSDIWVRDKHASLIDATLLTITAKVVNDFFLQNPDKLSLLNSVRYGSAIWLGGEIFEMIYKKVFTIITGESLRFKLGKTDLFGMQFDNQRLLRRAITLIAICVTMKLVSRDMDIDSDFSYTG